MKKTNNFGGKVCLKKMDLMRISTLRLHLRKQARILLILILISQILTIRLAKMKTKIFNLDYTQTRKDKIKSLKKLKKMRILKQRS